MAWVLECERTTTGSERLVLLVLANHAHNDTWECWPSIELIGDEANIGRRRTVQAALADLEAKGLIERTVNGAIDTRIPAGKRPTLYRVVGVSQTATPQLPGTGVENRRAGVSKTATQTISEPSVKKERPSVSQEPASAHVESARELLNRELQRRRRHGEPAPAAKWIAIHGIIKRLLDAGHKPEAIADVMPSLAVWTINGFELALNKRRPRRSERNEAITTDRTGESGEVTGAWS